MTLFRLWHWRPFRALLGLLIALALLPAVLLLLLRVVNPPTTAFMHYTASRLQAADPAAEVVQQWLPLEAMAACMPLAVVAGEDQTFPDHHGFAWGSIRQALVNNARGGATRGGSTITQQTAKNLFLWPGRSYVRKGLEAYITLWMNLLWSKRRVMEVYLNIAQFSRTAFGVEAASNQLFNVRAKELTTSQCAALAAVLPAPEHRDAAHPDAALAGRRTWIVQQMRQLGPGYLDGMAERR